MSDSPSPDPFDFEPVPSRTHRRADRTPERQRIFVGALRRVGPVSAAAAPSVPSSPFRRALGLSVAGLARFAGDRELRELHHRNETHFRPAAPAHAAFV